LDDVNDQKELEKHRIKDKQEGITTEVSNINPFEKNLNEDGTFKNQFDISMNVNIDNNTEK